MANPWQELEIEPTGDVVAIRRAYRARLRRVGAADAARLLAAYEGAIAALPLATRPTEGATEGAAGAIADALARSDAVGAATLIAEGRAADALKLRDDIEAVERLLALLTTPRLPSLEAIERSAALLGWLDDRDQLPAGAAFERLRARLAAERWLRHLTQASDRNRPFDPEAAAARRLLGRKPSLADRVVAPRAAIATLLADFDRHREWVEHRFDPDHVEAARRLAAPKP